MNAYLVLIIVILEQIVSIQLEVLIVVASQDIQELGPIVQVPSFFLFDSIISVSSFFFLFFLKNENHFDESENNFFFF